MSIAREIVSFAIKAGSSDIHLEEESPIAVRVNSDIKISPQNLRSEDMDQLLLELIGADKLIYQDLEDLIDAVSLGNKDIKDFDCSCFNGEYITGGVSETYLSKLKKIRSS